MKITKTKLKQIIKEEVVKLLVEQDEYDDYDDYDYEEEELTYAQKIIKLLISDDSANVQQGLSILDALEDPQPGFSQLEYQQLIDTIASHFVFDSKSNSITTQGFDLPQEIVPQQLGMILNYFAEKSDRVKNMLDQIERLNIANDFITNVDFLRFCKNLTSLKLNGCTSLENVDGLQGLTNLTDLNLYKCELLQNVDGLAGCTNLNWLNLNRCKSLQNVDGLKECTNLMYLYLSFCESLENVDGLKECTNLTSLNLGFCNSLQNVDGLKGCTNLTSLSLIECSSLPPELQERFESDSSGTAYEQFMEVLKG